MTVVPFAAVPSADWDAACDRSAEAWLFHRHAWVCVEAGFAAQLNLSFAVRGPDGRPAALFPLYLRTRPRGWAERVLDSGYHRHAGPACRDDLSPGDRSAALRAGMRHLFAEADRLNVDRVLLNVQNLAPAGGRAGEVPVWVEEYGFELGLWMGPGGDTPVPGMSRVFADQVVDLTPPADEVFRRLDSACQRAVRKADKAGLVFEPAGGDPVPEYYRLAGVSAERTGEALQPEAFYRQIWDSLAPAGRSVAFFARRDGQPMAALWLLVDKAGASYLGGISHPDALALRVNDWIHWRAMTWLREHGVTRYRLGPVFPEVPADWPVAKVSRFKAKFGAASVPVVQGSYFRRPEVYLEDAIREARRAVEVRADRAERDRQARAAENASPARDLAVVLRRYGYLAAPPNPTAADLTDTLGLWWPGCGRDLGADWDGVTAVFAGRGEAVLPGVQVRRRPGGGAVWEAGRPRRGAPAYPPLCEHATFTGPDVEPVWVTADGEAVLARVRRGGRKVLLVGLDVVEELVLRTQGDPRQPRRAIDTTRFQFAFERANYLFDTTLHPDHPGVPWADRLGFRLVRLLAEATDFPLAAPLPGGAAGLILLTGDDDQAPLTSYREQLDAVGDFPITYFLLPHTNHTPDTLRQLPPTVGIGLHVDALDRPDEYERICAEQCAAVRTLSGKPVVSIRNHGFLNRGYLGHLRAWEDCGLTLDVNYAGLDGTVLTGSLLPFRTRRADGTWSGHLGLLTAFGDGMRYITKLSDRAAARRISAFCAAVGRADPGVVVLNFHPANIRDCRRMHEAVVAAGRAPGWLALGVGQYLDWHLAWQSVRFIRRDGRLRLVAPGRVERFVLLNRVGGRWISSPVPGWQGEHAVGEPARAAVSPAA